MEHNGFLFPPRNHEILAKRIQYLAEHRETRDVFGEISRDIILDKGDHNKEMAKVNTLYKRLVSD